MQSIETFADVVKDGRCIGTAWVGRDAEGRKGYSWRTNRHDGCSVEPNSIDVYSIKSLKEEIPSGAKLVRH